MAFTLTAFADDVPPKKTQIDWLISGAGGDVVAAGGDLADVTGEFSYKFTSEDGSVRGAVQAKNGTVTILELGSDGKYTAVTSGSAFTLARHYTQHFATLTRTGHFHATHKLSARGTEEYPIKLGATTFITFGYPELEEGGIMNVMILENRVKFISELKTSIVSLPMSDSSNNSNTNNNNTDNNNADNNSNSGNTSNNGSDTNNTNTADNNNSGNNNNSSNTNNPVSGGNSGGQVGSGGINFDAKGNPKTAFTFGLTPVLIAGLVAAAASKKKDEV